MLNTFQEDVLSQAKSVVPGWKDVSRDLVSFEQQHGGMTNVIYKVGPYKDVDGPEYVLVRIVNPELQGSIDRVKEMSIISECANAGIGPQLYGTCEITVPEDTDLIDVDVPWSSVDKLTVRFEEWIDGRPLTIKNLKDPMYGCQMARHIASFHGLQPTELSSEIERSASIISSLNKQLLQYRSKMRHIEDMVNRSTTMCSPLFIELLRCANWDEEISFVESIISEELGDVILSHGDLQVNNWLLVEKESEEEASSSHNNSEKSPHGSQSKMHRRRKNTNPESPNRLYIIDYEYAAPNPRGFDLGNLLTEHLFEYGQMPFKFYYFGEDSYPSLEWQGKFFYEYVSLELEGEISSRFKTALCNIDRKMQTTASRSTGSSSSSSTSSTASNSDTSLDESNSGLDERDVQFLYLVRKVEKYLYPNSDSPSFPLLRKSKFPSQNETTSYPSHIQSSGELNSDHSGLSAHRHSSIFHSSHSESSNMTPTNHDEVTSATRSPVHSIDFTSPNNSTNNNYFHNNRTNNHNSSPGLPRGESVSSIAESAAAMLRAQALNATNPPYSSVRQPISSLCPKNSNMSVSTDLLYKQFNIPEDSTKNDSASTNNGPIDAQNKSTSPFTKDSLDEQSDMNRNILAMKVSRMARLGALVAHLYWSMWTVVMGYGRIKKYLKIEKRNKESNGSGNSSDTVSFSELSQVSMSVSIGQRAHWEQLRLSSFSHLSDETLKQIVMAENPKKFSYVLYGLIRAKEYKILKAFYIRDSK